MNLVSVLTNKITGFFLGIVSTFRKLLCFLHIVRRRKNSGSILPLVANSASGLAQGEVQMSSLPSNDFEMQSWDSWDADSGFGQPPSGVNPASADRTGNTVGHNHSNNVLQQQRSRTDSDAEPKPEIDYFQDMEPQIKRTAKIMVRKKTEDNGAVATGMSSRLAMSSAPLPVAQSGELGHWEESESAWSAEALEDLSWEAESAIKEKKRQERETRQQEQQRKKLERERERNMKTDSRLTAVKLS